MSTRGKQGILAVVALAALVVAVTATAASPREIYADFADNGRLDQTYSRGDLERAQNDAAIQGYGNPTVTGGLEAEIEQQLGATAGQSDDGAGIDAVGRSGGTLPFTGVDIALLTAGAGFLILLGWGFRRVGRAGR